ncbi:hypothetical protein [Lysinibacter sp. HNR]|uniref:hypothetical protein n=1 Tax=Lysinibacter sp. HNR TaxID=3031408 RepID=UPI00243519D9|nr:hypothetical protein [Lysinibacter sp. HNR]WGD36628.1 hypothetical protein FrondiHNR_09170 [Lysinibacter sp. HNR]
MNTPALQPSPKTPLSVSASITGWYFFFYTIVLAMSFTLADAGTPGVIAYCIAVITSALLAAGMFMLARNLRREALTRDYPARAATLWRRLLAVIFLTLGILGSVTGAPYIFATFILATSVTSGDGGITALVNYTLFSLIMVTVLSLGAMLWRAGGAYPGHGANGTTTGNGSSPENKTAPRHNSL